MQEAAETGGKKALRQERLIAELSVRGYLSLTEISARFDVTTQTARRDVMELETEGRLRRMHGGAMILSAIDPEELHRRRVRNVDVKARIAARVAELVPDGAALFLDTGTTCEAVARALAARRELRILTYSLRIAAWLRENTDFTIAIPGGFVRQVDGGIFHEKAEAFLDSFRFDVAIVSVSGVDPEGNLGDDDLAEVGIVQKAMRNSARVLLAIDSSKFDRRGMVQLATLEAVDLLVTDHAAGPEFDALLDRAGVALHRV